MYIDAIFAMIVYLVTVTSCLDQHCFTEKETSTSGKPFLEDLSNLYTTTLGAWAEPFFYFGAFVVLFSTAFSALGAWTRQFTDAFGRVGLLDFDNFKSRRIWFGILAVVIPTLWALVHLLFQKPVWIVVGGVSTSIILLVILFAAIVFKNQRKNLKLRLGDFMKSPFG